MSRIRTRKLGASGLEVSELGLGGVYLSRDRSPDPSAPVRLVRRALELGIAFFDTAPVYAGGQPQGIIGEALSGGRDSCVLATKCGRWPWQDGPYFSS